MQGWQETVKYLRLLKAVRSEAEYVSAAELLVELLEQIFTDKRFEYCAVGHNYLGVTIWAKGKATNTVYIAWDHDDIFLLVPNFVYTTVGLPSLLVGYKDCLETLNILLNEKGQES